MARLHAAPLVAASRQAWQDAVARLTLHVYHHPARFLVTFLAVPLALVCGGVYLMSERQWRAREGQSLLVSARLASRTIEEELRRMRQLEEAVAEQPRFLEAVRREDRARLHETLQLLSALAPQASRLLVTDPTGRIVSDWLAPGAQSSATPDPPAPSDVAVSPVYLYDGVSGEKAVVISSLLLEGQTALGALRAHVRLGAMAHWLEKIRIEPAGFLYVVDAQGLLVSYPFQLLPGRPKNVSHWAPVSAAVGERGRVVRFAQGRPSVPWTAGVVAMAPFGWRVVAQQPDALMLKPLHQLGGSLAGLIAFLTLLISGVVMRWAHVHRVTLHLLAQQRRLLKSAQQQHVLEQLRRAGGPTTEPGHAA